MDKHFFDFTDQRLDAGIAEHCALTVLAGTEGFAFVCTGPDGNTLALKSWQYPLTARDAHEAETEMRKIFGSEPALSYQYESARCAFFNRNVTLVPRRMFDADNLPAYFNLLLPASEYEYGCDVLPEFECFLVYALEPALLQICRQYFPEGRVMHQVTPLLKDFRNRASRTDYSVFANMRNQVVQIAVFDRLNLLFYNTFECQKPGDLLYFVLLAYDQFRLSPEEIQLTIAGYLPEDSDAYRLLARYVRNIRFTAGPESSQLPVQAFHEPAHYWFDLFAVATNP